MKEAREFRNKEQFENKEQTAGKGLEYIFQNKEQATRKRLGNLKAKSKPSERN